MIGFFFGDTDFPNIILKTIKRKKIKYLVIDLSKSKKFKNDKNSHYVSIGQFGKIINILKENNCNKVLFAGKVSKPNFSKLKLESVNDFQSSSNAFIVLNSGSTTLSAGINKSKTNVIIYIKTVCTKPSQGSTVIEFNSG